MNSVRRTPASAKQIVQLSAACIKDYVSSDAEAHLEEFKAKVANFCASEQAMPSKRFVFPYPAGSQPGKSQQGFQLSSMGMLEERDKAISKQLKKIKALELALSAEQKTLHKLMNLSEI